MRQGLCELPRRSGVVSCVLKQGEELISQLGRAIFKQTSELSLQCEINLN